MSRTENGKTTNYANNQQGRQQAIQDTNKDKKTQQDNAKKNNLLEKGVEKLGDYVSSPEMLEKTQKLAGEYVPGSDTGSSSSSAPSSKSSSTPSSSAAPQTLTNVSAPPSAGTENGPIKVEFQALYDYAYLEIKQCFCKGMADLFSDAMIPASDHVYEAIEKAMYIDVIDPEQGKIMSQINPEYENIIGAQVENIVQKIMNNPDPQVKIDIRKNLAGGCQLTKEIYESQENVPITRKIPTAIVGGKKKHKKNTSRKSQKKKNL